MGACKEMVGIITTEIFHRMTTYETRTYGMSAANKLSHFVKGEREAQGDLCLNLWS